MTGYFGTGQQYASTTAETHTIAAAAVQAFKNIERIEQSASKTQQATLLQNKAAGLQDCLSRAEHKQAQLQETLNAYADAADNRIQQLEQALAAALEEVSLSWCPAH